MALHNAVSRYKFSLLGGVVVAPWIWSVAFVPAWVALVSATVALAAIAAGVYLLHEAEPEPPARVPLGDIPVKDTAGNLHNLLHRWSGMANDTHENLHDVRQQIHGVMEQTEQAVLNLSGSFRNITTKTNEQLAYTLNLLQKTHGVTVGADYAQGEQAPSLPEYIRAAEDMLHRLANELLRCTDAALAVLAHENDMQIGDQKIDRLLGDGQATLTRLNVLAASHADDARVAELHTLGREALALSENAHHHLRAQRVSRGETYKNICNIAAQAKDVADAIKQEMAQLTGNMLRKNEEVAALVGRINALGEEVRKDIYRVIVELQFQDITHQKLERVKTPLLNELGQGLRAIAQETHLLYEKLRRSVFRGGDDSPRAYVPAPKAEAPFGLAAHTAATKPELGNKVELF